MLQFTRVFEDATNAECGIREVRHIMKRDFRATIIMVAIGIGAFVPVQGQNAPIPADGIVAAVPPLQSGPPPSTSLPRVPSAEFVRRGLADNPELAAARLEIDRARARLTRAGTRPNPSFDITVSNGNPVNNPGERGTAVGVTVPLELGGKRARRIEVAELELTSAEAEFADRERRLMSDIRLAFTDAASARRDLELTDETLSLQGKLAEIVRVRVEQGDAPPLDARLLSVEIERLRSGRALLAAKLENALTRLKLLSAWPPDDSFLPADEAGEATADPPFATVEEATATALRDRPDLRSARLTETAAEAGVKLARAEGVPPASVSIGYSADRSFPALPVPLVSALDQARFLKVGFSIGIPVFDRNQAGRADAAALMAQTRHRREFAEQAVRADVRIAFDRLVAARTAVGILKAGALDPSAENLATVRGAYDIGAFRITDVITEQRRSLDARREYVEALTELFRARIALDTAVGATAGRKP